MIVGKSKLDIPGAQAHDTVTLQLRVWENFGQTVHTWDEAIHIGSIRGKSYLFNYWFPHQEDFQNPNVSSNIAHGLTYFSLSIPEPSLGSLAPLDLSGLVFVRISRNSSPTV